MIASYFSTLSTAMIKALLVDDELHNLINLEFMLNNDCEGIAVVGKVQSVAAAKELLESESPDVVFLDITMPNEDGFGLLDSLTPKNIKVVFVTAHNQYALRALKASAVDYLLKPVRIDELQKAVEKVKLAMANPHAEEQNRQLLQHFTELAKQKNIPQKIAVPALGSVRFVAIDEIVALEADSNYTIIHLKDAQKLVISKTLKEFDEILDEQVFARIHKSYIVNINYVVEYSTTDGGVVKMADKSRWSISRRQLDVFLKKMQASAIMLGKPK